MNSLIMCSKRPTEEVLKLINKKKYVHLSLPEIAHLVKKIKSEAIKLHLEPIPEEWRLIPCKFQQLGHPYHSQRLYSFTPFKVKN